MISLDQRIVALATIGAALFSVPEASDAQPAANGRKFDVASVRLNKDAIGGSLVRTPGGMTAHNAEFSRLIEMAFQTRLTDLSQVPGPIRSARFDIVAKAERPISGDEYWEMLRSLLEDRLMLKFHYQARDMLLYSLVLANKRDTLGPKISRSPDAGCPANPSGSDFCGVSSRPGLMIGQRVAMARIANELSTFAGRPVQDRTRLAGAFNFVLRWTPDEYVSSDGRPRLLNGAPVDISSPPFFSAIQQELGLKLESKRGTVEILVIDHAENPSEN
jgi:bla regulator protein blaR1